MLLKGLIGGPSIEFSLGRIYQGVVQYVFDHDLKETLPDVKNIRQNSCMGNTTAI